MYLGVRVLFERCGANGFKRLSAAPDDHDAAAATREVLIQVCRAESVERRRAEDDDALALRVNRTLLEPAL